MTTINNIKTIASILTLLLLLSTAASTLAMTENNYKTDNNFLTDTSETISTENGYKANIILNPHTTGIYANENGYKLDLAINPAGIGGALKESNYRLDLFPEKSFSDFRVFTLINVTNSKAGCVPTPLVCKGYTARVNVTILVGAIFAQNLIAIAYANSTIIGTKTLSNLAADTQTIITFIWNTTEFAKGDYTLWVHAISIPLGMETEDSQIDGYVTVSMVGDVIFDGKVDVKDVYAVARAYGTSPEGPNPPGRKYNPNLDINDDGRIDVRDYYIVCKQYGEVDP